MNLLPMVITDGGQMLKLAFEKIFSDKQMANKVWAFIGSVFIFTLLAALGLRGFFWVLGLVGLT
jgi:membrane-associated protease RseP (regulator of RpoE activity)